jgi:hypothetical protein
MKYLISGANNNFVSSKKLNRISLLPQMNFGNMPADGE